MHEHFIEANEDFVHNEFKPIQKGQKFIICASRFFLLHVTSLQLYKFDSNMLEQCSSGLRVAVVSSLLPLSDERRSVP